MSKKILGLDLGTTSIGWALVTEAENGSGKSSIVKAGSRIIQYGDNLVTVDKSGKVSPSREPEKEFASGKGLSPNASRTRQRAARRNLQRYKLRRENLIELLKEKRFIPVDFSFSEQGNNSTFRTYRYRSLAVTEKILLDEFARVLLMINKKRGYKSSRKVKGDEDGQLIDGMSVAKFLYENNQTPGQFISGLLRSGKKSFPDFYRSDLYSEFDRIWKIQHPFHPSLLTDENFVKLRGQKKPFTKNYFEKVLGIELPEMKGNFEEKRLFRYELRSKAVENEILPGELALVLTEINGDINGSSGYLGSISDRSKELYFNKLTVGQYLYNQIKNDPNQSLKKQVFYRQDYLDEFNTIWEIQKKFYPELTEDLKTEIRDIIIFYQRRLKSQKGLLSFCEFESKQVEVTIDGKKKIKTRGLKVIPKSSPLFQEFKIWQVLNNLKIINLETNERFWLNDEARNLLFEELNTKPKLKKSAALKIILNKTKGFDLNYDEIEGNKTIASLYEAYLKIITASGHEEKELSKMRSAEVKEYVKNIFETLGITTSILDFDPLLEGKDFENQPLYQLWHLLYSFEGDNTRTGTEKLLANLKNKFGLDTEYAKIIASVALPNDYGSLSAKAIRKILPHLKEGFAYGGREDKPEERSACEYAGYRHSRNSLTSEEKNNKKYKDRLEVLQKNSLRNPIVEKILNQMIHVVNTAIDEYGKPDEIRIEMARELKMSAEERKEMSDAISRSTAEHEQYRKILSTEFGLPYVSRNDLIRYKLYLELKNNGFKTLYSNTYIAPNEVFSKKFDIEHILPKAKIYDDSFSNKTLELKSVNLEKGDRTALDFVKEKYGEEELLNYRQRVMDLFYGKSTDLKTQDEIEGLNNKTLTRAISKTKMNKLLMSENEIPSGFIERELRDSQYIARKAKSLLEEVCRNVNTTTGAVTDRLREDWQLINIMQELNWDKYHKLNLTTETYNDEGEKIKKIIDWTKRNDHRHHAMDAITVAFTKPSHVQYLNNVNARSDKSSSIYGIEQKELYRDKNNKLRFIPPIPLDEFRNQVKNQLENTLVSFKSGNKVVTKNVNKYNTKGGYKNKIQTTPRGALHQETFYGSIKRYKTREVKLGAALDLETIKLVASKRIREALLNRLAEYNNDPKVAFSGKNSPERNPVWIDALRTEKVPEKIKLVDFETIYTTRKEVNKDLKVDKVINPKIRKILEMRLQENNNDPKAAFSNLEENPIWLNKEKGICIKRVTITGVSNALALREKKDKDGKYILDDKGKRIPVDFVNTGNNHHVAVYQDSEGNLHEKVVTFFEAVERANQGLPVVDHGYNNSVGWKLLFTMKQNECFVFPNEKTGFDPNQIDLLNPSNYDIISPNLYRVQKLTTKDYTFRHHLETDVKDRPALKDIAYKRVTSLLFLKRTIKVKINHLGKIIKTGE